jgi:hypothetical protein
MTHQEQPKQTAMPKLISAERASELTGVSAARLVELATAGFAPHYCVDGGPPQFRSMEIQAWAKDNLVVACQGMPMPRMATLWTEETASPCHDAPRAIRHLDGLRCCAVPPRLCGIYFLCEAGEVVYVGQSIDVYSRVPQHKGKSFDAVYLFPSPASELDRMEGAFIRLLRPRLNGNTGPVTDAATAGRISQLLAEGAADAASRN